MTWRSLLVWPFAALAVACAATEVPADQTVTVCKADEDAPDLLTARTVPAYMLEEGLATDPNARMPIECPPNTRESGGRCFSTWIECPHGSRREFEGGKCVADVACPPGTDWSGFTCAPIRDETASTVLPPERLLPKTPTTGPTCTLLVNSIPSSSTVIDGRPLGRTPSRVVVSPGAHTVTFIHEERGRKSVSVRCAAGEHKTAAVKFD
jgi:hypothetical protein